MSDLKPVAELLTEVDNESNGTEGDILTLSNGVEVEILKVPPFLAHRIESKFRYPRIPNVFDEDKQREIPNPNDPEYLDQCKQVDDEKSDALMNLMIGMGSRVVYLPATQPAFDSPVWKEELEFYLGEPMPENEKALYLYWIKYVLITNAQDLAQIAGRVASKMGVSEVAVGEAMGQFKSS